MSSSKQTNFSCLSLILQMSLTSFGSNILSIWSFIKFEFLQTIKLEFHPVWNLSSKTRRVFEFGIALSSSTLCNVTLKQVIWFFPCFSCWHFFLESPIFFRNVGRGLILRSLQMGKKIEFYAESTLAPHFTCYFGKRIPFLSKILEPNLLDKWDNEHFHFSIQKIILTG